MIFKAFFKRKITLLGKSRDVFIRYLFGYTLPYNYGLLKLINDKIMPKGLTNNFVVQVRDKLH